MRRKIKKLFVLIISLLIFITQINVTNSIKAAEDAKIILENNTSRERFHVGRMIGESVPIDIKATSKSISGLTFTSGNSSIVSVSTINGERKLVFKSEGISVITMKVTVGKTNITKKLLASCLTKKNLSGKLRSGATVYQGCSDQQGISSDVSEIKGTNEKERTVDIKGVCGNYYQIFTKDGKTWTDRKEDFGYVKKSDVNLIINGLSIPNEIHIFNTKDEIIPLRANPVDYPVDKSKMRWTSSNNSIVTVDNNGKIHGCSEGNAVVTMNYDNGKFTGKCKVYVEPYIAVKSIKLIPDRDNIDDGLMGKFDVEILPENASIKKCDWVVSSDKMLQIDQSGRYLATSPGKVNVKVISRDNGLSDSCSLVINEVLATGMVLQKEDEIAVGETKEMSWRMIPANASNKRGTWTSSNTSIATIDSKGIVKGIKAGTVTITRKSELGFVKTCQLKVINYVEDIEINEGLLDMKIGTTKKLVANIIPGNAFKLIKWKTKDSSIVSVDKNGIIRANKLGETEITVYDQYTGAFDFVIVDVVKKLKKVEKKSKKKKSSKSKSKNDKKSSKKKTAKKKETKKKTAKKSNKKK